LLSSLATPRFLPEAKKTGCSRYTSYFQPLVKAATPRHIRNRWHWFCEVDVGRYDCWRRGGALASAIYEVTVGDALIRIIDTPRVGDTGLSNETICKRIAEAFALASGEIHVVFFVTCGRFNSSQIEAFNILRSMLLDDATLMSRTTIVFSKCAKFQEPGFADSLRASM
jgi:hypothetical protein